MPGTTVVTSLALVLVTLAMGGHLHSPGNQKTRSTTLTSTTTRGHVLTQPPHTNNPTTTRTRRVLTQPPHTNNPTSTSTTTRGRVLTQPPPNDPTSTSTTTRGLVPTQPPPPTPTGTSVTLSTTTTLAPTPAPVPAMAGAEVVNIGLNVAGVDLNMLNTNFHLRTAFENAIKTSIAAEAGTGLPQYVTVVLSAGSVKVAAAIEAAPSLGIFTSAVSSSLTSSVSTGSLQRKVASSVGGVPGIAAARTGAIVATVTAQPVVTVVPATPTAGTTSGGASSTATTPAEGTSGGASSTVMIALVVALCIVALMAVCLAAVVLRIWWRRQRASTVPPAVASNNVPQDRVVVQAYVVEDDSETNPKLHEEVTF